MNSFKRSNDSSTRNALLSTARQLFARDGFRGSSIRAITSTAGTNLGAVTYHFGSKRELFHAVLDDVTAPVRARIADLKDAPGNAVARIDETVNGLFAAIRKDPDIPRLIVHVLASHDPLPPPILLTMQTVVGHLTHLIEEGQHDGSLRQGSAQMMALTLGSQPIFFGIYRRALKEALGLDLTNRDTSQQLTETVIDFINAGLTASSNNATQSKGRN